MDMSTIEYNLYKRYFDKHPDINEYFMHLIYCLRLSQCADVKWDMFIPPWLQVDKQPENMEDKIKAHMLMFGAEIIDYSKDEYNTQDNN